MFKPTWKATIAIAITFVLIITVAVFIRARYLKAVSVDSYRWTQVTAHAEWKPGYSFSALAFNNKLWIFGKSDGNWVSDDGKNWVRVQSNGDMPAASGYDSYVVFNNEVYAIGGTEDRSDLEERQVGEPARQVAAGGLEQTGKQRSAQQRGIRIERVRQSDRRRTRLEALDCRRRQEFRALQ